MTHDGKHEFDRELSERAEIDFAGVNTRLRTALLDAAIYDPLSGCLNRVYLVQRTDEEIERCARYGGRLSLLLMIIEGQIADDARGKAAVRRLADVARRCVRTTDMLARWEANEFVAVLPGTTLAGATRMARRIKKLVKAGAIDAGEELPTPLTIGAATWLGTAEPLTNLVERARGGVSAARAEGDGRIGIA